MYGVVDRREGTAIGAKKRHEFSVRVNDSDSRASTVFFQHSSHGVNDSHRITMR
jgi:hypothetical protein